MYMNTPNGDVWTIGSSRSPPNQEAKMNLTEYEQLMTQGPPADPA